MRNIIVYVRTVRSGGWWWKYFRLERSMILVFRWLIRGWNFHLVVTRDFLDCNLNIFEKGVFLWKREKGNRGRWYSCVSCPLSPSPQTSFKNHHLRCYFFFESPLFNLLLFWTFFGKGVFGKGGIGVDEVFLLVYLIRILLSSNSAQVINVPPPNLLLALWKPLPSILSNNVCSAFKICKKKAKKRKEKLLKLYCSLEIWFWMCTFSLLSKNFFTYSSM